MKYVIYPSKSCTGGVILLLTTVLASCQREIPSSDVVSKATDEIVFSAAGPAITAGVTTKASAVTSLSSFNASAVTGAVSDTQVWTNVSFSGDNEDGYKGDKWWPVEDQNYRFFASNLSLTYSSSGATVAATNATDVVCAYSASPSYKTRNTLSFEHIFARLGSVTVSAATGYTISNVSITVVPKTGGTYNLKTGAGQTDGTGWSSVSAAGSPSTIASATGANANDIYLVPGTYTLTASWRAVRGDYTEDIEGMQCDVDLVAGKINNISTTLSGNAKEVVFGVSLSAWSERNADVTFPTANYLKFKFTTNGSVQWQNVKGDIQYSKNGGEWTDFSGSTVSMSAGDEIWFKGSLTSGVGGSSPNNSSRFFTTGNFLVSGDVTSLCDFNETLQSHHFANLFNGCVGLDIDSSKQLLLPATTLTEACYQQMFMGCTSLTSAPALPATTLANNCYSAMFYGCTSLTSAPALPATTLAAECYVYMFYRCTSLTSAPALPATTLVSSCYYFMFQNCSALNYIKAFFTTTPSSSYTRNWVSGVAATGTFVKADDASWDVTGDYGVPTGWTVVTLAESLAIPGEFSISSTEKVKFAKGNLQAVIGGGPTDEYNYSASSWNFAEHQYDFIGENTSFAVGTTVDTFGWVGASASYDSYGLCTKTSSNNAYYGTSTSDALKTDWGSIPGVVSACGDGWYTLSADEWIYVINGRTSGATANGISNARYTVATINTDGTSVKGVILFPDGVTIAAGEVTAWGAINNASNWLTKCTSAQWSALESKGCVFLPAAGGRNGTSVNGNYGYYWSSTPFPQVVNNAVTVYFSWNDVSPSGPNRSSGFPVRLVKDAN